MESEANKNGKKKSVNIVIKWQLNPVKPLNVCKSSTNISKINNSLSPMRTDPYQDFTALFWLSNATTSYSTTAYVVLDLQKKRTIFCITVTNQTFKPQNTTVEVQPNTQLNFCLPVWRWRILQWAVRSWTASWRSGRSVCVPGPRRHSCPARALSGWKKHTIKPPNSCFYWHELNRKIKTTPQSFRFFSNDL